MDLPNWIGIPGAILLIGAIVYGFRQGMKVTTKQDSPPPERTGGGRLL
jgi:TM2 domain-containing membrane protein YozV